VRLVEHGNPVQIVGSCRQIHVARRCTQRGATLRCTTTSATCPDIGRASTTLYRTAMRPACPDSEGVDNPALGDVDCAFNAKLKPRYRMRP
jgi:hypothetical protein